LKQTFDAGEMGCGSLIFKLRMRMRELEPGEQLEVIARDQGARQDLPAWCRMTGHTLVTEDHPVYVIQKKTD